VADFPSMRWPELRRVLEREPLRYRVARQTGSHRQLKSEAGYPDLNLAFHDRQELPPGLVRKVLCRDVGLSEPEALELL
jgi:predicted RNA binding protein YcfA (HicA-like mRNA interferase family)